MNLEEANQNKKLDKIIREFSKSFCSALLNDKEDKNLKDEKKFHFENEKAYSYNKKIKFRNQININNQKIHYVFLLVYLFILNFSKQYNQINIYSSYSNITIKLRGSGEQ